MAGEAYINTEPQPSQSKTYHATKLHKPRSVNCRIVLGPRIVVFIYCLFYTTLFQMHNLAFLENQRKHIIGSVDHIRWK